METYGKELILDIHECKSLPCKRPFLNLFCKKLCSLINMERADLHWWDYEGYQEEYDAAPSHLKGISLVQFISTSDIVIHTVDDLKTTYLNIFSCKEFDENIAKEFCENYFSGKVISQTVVNRL